MTEIPDADVRVLLDEMYRQAEGAWSQEEALGKAIIALGWQRVPEGYVVVSPAEVWRQIYLRHGYGARAIPLGKPSVIEAVEAASPSQGKDGAE